MSILITGAGGMIGSHLAETLLTENSEVRATYLHPTIVMSNVEPGVHYSELDVCDREAVFRFIARYKPSEIYHLAAQSLPTASWKDPWGTIRTNLEGTINIFEAVLNTRLDDRRYDPMTVVACSSAEYGASLTPDRMPVTEDAPLLPLHPYGVSKVGQDLLAFQYFQNHGLRCIRARIFNCTGPRKCDDVASDFAKQIVRARREGGTVRHGNLESARAIIDVRDMVRALIALARNGTPGEVYNICAERAYKISEVLELYFSLAGEKLSTEPDPALFRHSDEPIIFGDTTKLRRDTGWAPSYELRQTLTDILAYEEQQYVHYAK